MPIAEPQAGQVPTAVPAASNLARQEQTAYRTPYDSLIAEEAQRRGIDPALAQAVAYWESGGDPEIRGAAGEVGLFQVIPRDMAYRYPWASSRPSAAEMATPETQVAAGLDVLAGALKQAGGHIEDALAIYNSGRALAQAPDITRQKYVPGVTAIYRALTGQALTETPTAKPPASAVSSTPQPLVAAPVPTAPMLSPTAGYGSRGKVGEYATWEELYHPGVPGQQRLTPTGAPDLAAYLNLRPASKPALTPTTPAPERGALASATEAQAKGEPTATITIAADQPAQTPAATVATTTPTTVAAEEEEELLKPPMSLLRGGLLGGATLGMAGLAANVGGRAGLLGGILGAVTALVAPKEAEPVFSALQKALMAGSNIARQLLVTPTLLASSEEELREAAAPVEKQPMPTSLAQYVEQVKEAYGPIKIGIPVNEVVERIKRIFTSTPDQRQAAWEASRAGYTPGKAQEAYLRIIEGENPDLVVEELYEPTGLEFVAETVLDPLNLVAAGLGRWGRAQAATRTLQRLTKPDPRPLEKLAADLAQPISTSQLWNPLRRTSESLQSHLLEESSTVINHILADASDDAERLVRLRTFASNPDDFARIFKQPIAASTPGKSAALLLQQLGDIENVMAKAAKEAQGLDGTRYYDHIAEALFTRMGKALDNVIPVQRTVYEKMAQPVVDAVIHPINRLFSYLYLNRPGYWVRNAANNLMTALVDGVMPLENAAEIAKFERSFGRLAVAAEKGITVVGEKRPAGILNYFIEMSQRTERWFSRRIAYKATSDFMFSMWPRRVRDLLDEIAPHLSPEQARTLRYRMGAALNENELASAISSVLGPQGQLGRSLDPDLIARIDKVSPGLGRQVRTMLETASDPSDFAKRVQAEVGPELERLRAAPNNPNRPVPPDSPEAEILTIAREAGWPEQELGNFYFSDEYISTRRLYDRAVGAVDSALEVLEKTRPDLVQEARGLFGRFHISRRQALRSYFEPGPGVTPSSYPQVINEIVATSNEYVERLARLAGMSPAELLVPRRPPDIGPSSARMPTPRSAADMAQEFAEAARAAGFTAKPDGSFDLGNEVRMANALRQAGVPVEGRRVIFDRLTEEQQRQAIAVLRARGVPPTAPSQAPPGAMPYRPGVPAAREPVFEPSAFPLDRPELGRAPDPQSLYDRLNAPRPAPGVSEATVADEIEALLRQVVQDVSRSWERQVVPGAVPNQAAWMRKAITDLNAIKAAATFAGAEARNFALLDYSDRRAIDVLSQLFLIYPYWSSRTYPNWMTRVASKPNIVAAFLRYQNHMRHKVEEEGLPEWLSQYIELNVPGLPEPLYANIRFLLDPLYELSNDYDDPVVTRSVLGRFREHIADTVGMSAHPLITITDAALRYAQGKEEEVSRVMGHLGSHTRLLRYLTGKLGLAEGAGYTLEPWLWRGSPLVGGDDYAILRATRQLATMMNKGEITPTEAAEAARAFSINNFDHPLVRRALKQEIDDRFLPTVASFAFALPTRVRTPEEIEIDEAMAVQTAIWSAADRVSEEQWKALWNDFYRQYPFMSVISLARKDRMQADTAWVWNVMARVPPGQRQAAFLEAGVSKEIMEKFWAADKESDLPRLEQLAEHERMRILAAAIELSQAYDVPTPTMTAEWETVSKRYQAMQEAIERQFPGGFDLERQYYALKEQNSAQATAFLEANPQLEQMWQFRKDYRYRDHLLMWYYGPAAREQAISYIWNVYFSLPEDTGARSRLVKSMGQDFADTFMKKNYDAISDAQLFSWNAFLDGLIYYTRKDMPEEWQGIAPTPEEMRVRTP